MVLKNQIKARCQTAQYNTDLSLIAISAIIIKPQENVRKSFTLENVIDSEKGIEGKDLSKWIFDGSFTSVSNLSSLRDCSMKK